MTQTFLNPAQVDELVALYEAGATLVELGERFGVHRRTAAAHLVRRSVPIRRRGLDECNLAEAAELYAGGLSLMEVGLRFGVSQQAVRRALANVAMCPSAPAVDGHEHRHDWLWLGVGLLRWACR